MTGSNSRILLFFLLFLGVTFVASAQTKEELQEKRQKLNERIDYTNQLIKKKKTDQRLTQTELVILNKKIGYREELINTINYQVADLEERVRENEEMVKSLEQDLRDLKEEYARMIRYAYKNRNAYERMMFIFAAEDLYEAYKRLKYLQQYADYRERQAKLIERTQRILNEKVTELKDKKAEKEQLLREKLQEKEHLASDRQSQQKSLEELRKEESRLKEQLEEQQRKREQLTAAIKRVIEEEIRKTRARNEGNYRLTPEARQLSSDFEKNQGKLPWPVERGVITSTFGEHPHPTLGSAIKIKNNGVDISTNKGSVVRSVFQGEVSKIIVIQGAGKAVMIKHGAYRTVYSNLQEAFVSTGDKVTVKQPIGRVLTNDRENKAEAHFEIWKITGNGNQKKDPENWIYKE